MHGLNMMDYGARFIDMANPVWPGPDPLMEKFYSISPYVYCLNNPISFVDSDGKRPSSPKHILSMLNNVAKLPTFEKAWTNSRHGDITTEEWGFSISISNDGKSIIARNLHTDGKSESSSVISNMPLTEQLIGLAHTHQYSFHEGAMLGVGFSSADIIKLGEYTKPDISILRGYSSNTIFYLFAESGDRRFALVITDVKKATLFFENNKPNEIDAKYNSIYLNPNNKSLSMQHRALIATKAVIGDSNTSGISIYVTTDKNKENFKEL